MKNHARSREIREELDRTRASLDRAFDALGSKLTPAQLFWDGMGIFRSGAGSAISRAMHLAQQHPLPASVIGLGVGWLLLDNARSGRGDGTYVGTPAEQYGGYGTGRPGTWAGTPSEQGAPSGANYGRGEHAGGQYPSASAGASAGGSAPFGEHEAGAASRVRESAGEAVQRAGEVASRAGERVSETAGAVKEKVAHAASTAKEQVSRAAETVREQAAQAGEAVRHRAARVGEQARHTARRAGSEFDDLLREQPLAVGLGALAVGVLAGLMLPATRREDEMLGEVRDRKVDNAREAARATLERGKDVARTAFDRAKDTVKEEVERQQLTPRAVAERVVGGEGRPPGPTV